MAESIGPDPLIAEARRDWKLASEAEDEQRKAIVAAKEFRAGNQWASALKISREGGAAISGQPAQPPRPCLVVDRLAQPVRQVSNIIKNADFGFDVLPNGGGSDTDTAEIFKGYMRRVMNESRGESPVEWAADQAIEGGIGWFRLRTDYVHDTWDGDPNSPEVMDQHVVMERIANNLSVYCDPSAMRPTRSDARFMLVVEDMRKDVFTDTWPDADIRGLEEFQSTGDMPGWVSKDTIRVAEYWRIKYSTRTFYQLEKDGPIAEGKPPKGAKPVQVRDMRVPQVLCDKINAVESLEKYAWLGCRIPLIPVLGEELNIDGRPLLRGIIAEGMDAQRMVNYTYSGAMEIFALSSKKAPMVVAESIDDFKAIWDTRTIYSHSYLPYRQFTDQGQEIRQPIPDTTESPIQAAVELMRISEEAIKATTSTGDASLGNSNPNERSGKALQALQAQSELANSNYPDNVRRALIYAGEMIAEVAPKITRPGQILQIVGADEEPEQVMIGQPYQEGEKGVPQPVAGADGKPMQGPHDPGFDKALHKFYDLNNGRYAVTVTVGKASSTKREEGSQALGALIPHLPPLMAAIATPEYVEQLSFPGAQKIAEMLRKGLPPEVQQSQDGQPNVPPQIQAALQQLQAQNQQLHQAMQTDQVKVQGQLQQAQIKSQADMQIAQMQAQADLQREHLISARAIAVARIGAAKSAMDIAAESAEERLATGLKQQHEAQQNAIDRAHEVGMAAMGQQHAQDNAQMSAENAQQAQAADHANAQQMAAQAAQQPQEGA